MYSILKSEKRVISHEKGVSVTASIFLTNSHILFCFSNSTIAIYFVSFLESSVEKEEKIWEQKVSSMVVVCKRLQEAACIILCKNLSNVYLLELLKNESKQSYCSGRLRPLVKSEFGLMLEGQYFNELVNSSGCSIELHCLVNGCFIIQYQIYEDSKVILDCYSSKKESEQKKWRLRSFQFFLQTPGHYVIQLISRSQGYICLYQQTTRQEEDWSIKIIHLFFNTQKEQQQKQIATGLKQTSILLPQDKFCQKTVITQIFESFSFNSYMIVTISKLNNQIKLYSLHLNQNEIGSTNGFFINQVSIFNPVVYNLRSLKILEINKEAKVLYAITDKHEFVQGQLYENSLLIICGLTGKVLEAGFLTLRNCNFSPNYQYMLDVAFQFDKLQENKTFFHIRKLLSKKSLYMHLIEGHQDFKNLSESTKRMIIQYL